MWRTTSLNRRPCAHVCRTTQWMQANRHFDFEGLCVNPDIVLEAIFKYNMKGDKDCSDTTTASLRRSFLGRQRKQEELTWDEELKRHQQ